MADCVGDLFPLGRNANFYVVPEGPFTHPDGGSATITASEFGIPIYPVSSDSEQSGGRWVSTNAIAPLSLTMGFEQSRDFTESASGGRGRVKGRLISGKQSGTFSIETYLEVAESGAAAGPDTWWLFMAALGDGTTADSGTPKRYKVFLPKGTGNCLPTFNLHRVVPEIYGESLTGCAIDTMTISVSSGDPIKCSFSGQAYGHFATGKTLAKSGVDYSDITTGSGTPSGQVIELADIFEIYNLTPGQNPYSGSVKAASTWSWAKNVNVSDGGYDYDQPNVLQDDTYNDGAGTSTEDQGQFKNNSISAGGKIGPTASAGQNYNIVPYFPRYGTEFATPKPLSSVDGSVSIQPYYYNDSGTHTAITNAPITAMEITVNNNIKPVDDQAFTESSFAGFIPGYRDVTGTISMRLKTDIAALLLYRRELFRRCVMVIKLGDITDRYVQIDMKYVEFQPSTIEVAGQDEMTVSVPFKSLVSDQTAASVVEDIKLSWL